MQLTVKLKNKMPAAKFEISREYRFCSNSFFAKTMTSVYCSPRCSKLAYKQKKKEESVKQQKIQNALKISDSKDYLSVAEAVVLYDVSRYTIYRLIRKGRVTQYNLGQRLTKV